MHYKAYTCFSRPHRPSHYYTASTYTGTGTGITGTTTVLLPPTRPTLGTCRRPNFAMSNSLSILYLPGITHTEIFVRFPFKTIAATLAHPLLYFKNAISKAWTTGHILNKLKSNVVLRKNLHHWPSANLKLTWTGRFQAQRRCNPVSKHCLFWAWASSTFIVSS